MHWVHLTAGLFNHFIQWWGHQTNVTWSTLVMFVCQVHIGLVFYTNLSQKSHREDKAKEAS